MRFNALYTLLGVFNLRIMKDRNEYLKSIKNGTHKQFLYSKKKEKVVCKCGHSAVWFRGAFLCGTITAYPCKYN